MRCTSVRKTSLVACLKPKARTVRKTGTITPKAFKITLETPDGTQEVECDGDTYILDAAEVRDPSPPLRYCTAMMRFADRFHLPVQVVSHLLPERCAQLICCATTVAIEGSVRALSVASIQVSWLWAHSGQIN